MHRRLIHILGLVFGLLLLAVAFFVLYRKLSSFTVQDIEKSLRNIPTYRVVVAILLTYCYYTLTTFYDTLAFRFIGHPLPYRRIALAAFTGYAFSHNVGFSLISSGTVRYRIHSSFGLTGRESAKIIAFCGLSYWIGFLFVCAMLFLTMPMKIPAALHLPFDNVRIVGIIALGLLALYGWYTTHALHGHKIGKVELPKLTPKVFALQILIGSLDWIFSAAVLYVLLPHTASLPYERLFEIFVLAQIAGIVSQVPGGIGVFEGILLLFLPKHFPVTMVVGALLVYRLIFYVLPLLVATVLLTTHEVRMSRRVVKKQHSNSNN